MYRRIAASLCLASVSLISGAHAQTDIPRLSGLTKATVGVDVTDPPTGPSTSGVTEDRLRTIIELRLRTAGIKVLSDDEDTHEPGFTPRVYLSTQLMELKTGSLVGYAIHELLMVLVTSKVSMNGSYAPQELYIDTFMATSTQQNASNQVETLLNQLLDGLINKWLAANPR